MDQSIKSEKSLKDAPLPPLPFARHIKEAPVKTKKEGTTATIEEALDILNDMRNMNAAVKKQLDEICSNAGWTPDYLKKYLSNSSNFSHEQWEALLKEEESLKQIFKGSPQDEKSSKVQPGRKKVGARMRRNWIPMK